VFRFSHKAFPPLAMEALCARDPERARRFLAALVWYRPGQTPPVSEFLVERDYDFFIDAGPRSQARTWIRKKGFLLGCETTSRLMNGSQLGVLRGDPGSVWLVLPALCSLLSFCQQVALRASVQSGGASKGRLANWPCLIARLRPRRSLAGLRGLATRCHRLIGARQAEAASGYLASSPGAQFTVCNFWWRWTQKRSTPLA
jgi:hypothetical protein